MTDLEKLWREKSDEELAQKAASPSNFGEDTQRTIIAELNRRGMVIEEKHPTEGRGRAQDELQTGEDPLGEALDQLTPEQIDLALQRLRSDQNFTSGALLGLVASVVGAAVWAVVTIATEYQIGFMAIGVGYLVGIAVRIGGKGLDPAFSYLGAGLALFGCLLGNLFTVCGFIAINEGVSFFEVLSLLDFQIVQELMIETFSPLDLLFYGIAIYEGYKLSTRQLSVEDVTGAFST